MARRVPKGPHTRVCMRCGRVGKFSRSSAHQKVCDECKADPTSKARYKTENEVRWARSRSAATRRIIEAHRDEYDRYMAEELAAWEGLADDEWPGATLREVDDYNRRRSEAIAAGWRPRG